MSIKDTKEDLRKALRVASQVPHEYEQVKESRAICEAIQGLEVWKQARYVLLYSPSPTEPDVMPLANNGLRQEKCIAFPRFDPAEGIYKAALVQDTKHQLRKGKFGILEPVAECSELPIQSTDLILVPGMGFDTHGWRLGRGAGYYDRLLATTNGTRIGVAYNWQIAETIPHEPHDVRMNWILTPTLRLEIAP